MNVLEWERDFVRTERATRRGVVNLDAGQKTENTITLARKLIDLARLPLLESCSVLA